MLLCLQIFQRMTTYARYTVAMTFRICFTFGLLTVIYDWYFVTLLIVLLAVFNDGAMIALSKDKVVPSPVPNRWNLFSIFIQGEHVVNQASSVVCWQASNVGLQSCLLRLSFGSCQEPLGSGCLPCLDLLQAAAPQCMSHNAKVSSEVGVLTCCRHHLWPVPHPQHLGPVLHRHPQELL